MALDDGVSEVRRRDRAKDDAWIRGWGQGCNAAAKAAARLAALGFRVKERIGGLEYWRREGYAVDGKLGPDAPFA